MTSSRTPGRLFLETIESLRHYGAQGIVLGCTEIPLLVEPKHSDLPLFNTALLHAGKAWISPCNRWLDVV